MAANTLAAATKRSFHSIKSEHAENSIRKSLASGILTEDDAALIHEFIAELQASKNISLARTNKLVFTLVGWRRFIPPFKKITVGSLYEGLAALKSGKSERGVPFAQNTQRDFVTIIKQFILWMIENGYSELPEHKVRKLRAPPKNPMTIVAADLLTPEEIAGMVNACTRSIDRAIIMMLYEGGLRIGEIGAVQWGHLKFDNHGIALNVNFKTGKPRYIRLIMATEHLAKWKSDYPFTIEPDSYVFLTERKTPLTHASIHKQLLRIAKRSGIEKHFTPHIFRHSRITHLIQEGVQESVIKLMMWGNTSTNQFQTYLHLTGKDIDDQMRNHYHMSDRGSQPTEERLEPRECPSCFTVNAPTSNFCNRCGRPLTVEVKEGLEDKLSLARNSPDYQRILAMLKKDLNL
jgi:integrase/recombinase XerD